MTQRKVYELSVPQPYTELLEREARNSGRSVTEHVGHILSQRYDNLIRECQTCGYFIYAVGDDRTCGTCHALCCPYCAIPFDFKDLCFKCARGRGIDPTGRGGFHAAPQGKV